MATQLRQHPNHIHEQIDPASMAGKRSFAQAAGGAAAKKANNNSSSSSSSSGAKKHKRSLSANDEKLHKKINAPKKAEPVVVNVARSANSNWLALKSKIQAGDKPKKSNGSGSGANVEKKRDLDVRAHKLKTKEAKQQRRKQERTAEWIDNARILAMDCEMVGVGSSGKTSVLARCSIVDYDGNVVYDKHVRPVEKVTGTDARVMLRVSL